MSKIMVVDDEPDLREMVNLMLYKEGFETDIAEDGTDFLEKVDVFPVRAMVSDFARGGTPGIVPGGLT